LSAAGPLVRLETGGGYSGITTASITWMTPLDAATKTGRRDGRAIRLKCGIRPAFHCWFVGRTFVGDRAAFNRQ
jgi:hypothetical protein